MAAGSENLGSTQAPPTIAAKKTSQSPIRVTVNFIKNLSEVVKGCGELGYVSLKEIEELNEIYFIGVKKINKKLNEAKKELGY